jgi:hypothetical protein
MLKHGLMVLALASTCVAAQAAASGPARVPPPDPAAQPPQTLFLPPDAGAPGQPSAPAEVPAQVLPAPQGLSSEPVPMAIEQRLSNIEGRLAAQEHSQQVVYPVAPAPEAVPFEDTPMMAALPRSQNWEIGFEIGFNNLYLAGPAFGNYDPFGTTIGFSGGDELDTGYGFRFELWSFAQDDGQSQFDVETSATTFDFDLYKRFSISCSSLIVGAGTRVAELDFRDTAIDRHCRFDGGGMDFFGAWDHPLYIGQKWDLSFIGLGRMSILRGDWRDKTGGLVPDTNNDVMTILEASWGIEFRRRFGRNLDHFWYINGLFDIQDWQSSWMTANVGSSAGFHGVNFNVGVSW